MQEEIRKRYSNNVKEQVDTFFSFIPLVFFSKISKDL